MPTLYKLNLRGEHTRYLNAAGTRLPGVTTILGVLDKPALLEWAAREERAGIKSFVELSHLKLGMEYLDIDALPEEYYYAVKRDKAADAGTICHARIHASLRGMDLEPEGLPEEALAKSIPGWQRWHTWWNAEKLDLVATELPLVSETLQVGGTLDIVADIKTSKANSKYWPYPEHVAQVSAYRALWNEIHPHKPIVRTCIFRVGKDENDIGEVTWLSTGQLVAGLELFMAALSAYRAKRALSNLR
jgi:hypothetical protein